MSHRRLAALALVVFALASSSAAAAEIRVAVMEFSNASSDPEMEALGKGLQSMLTTDLANVATLKLVERDRLKDVQAELARGKSAAFDKATTARIGKLAGATHLFVGSYTVVGEKMRLDGRVISVQNGEVVLAEQIAGEKALFFELEQQLVQKVIAVLGVKLAPKERAALARPHTADFQAFQKFSDGIQAFDDGRLEQAVKALNEATAIDADFKLASLTLAEYERLTAEIRGKADAARGVEDEMKRLEKNKAIAAEVAVVKALWPIVDQKGSSPDVKLRRVAAACVLSVHYGAELGFRNRGPVNSEDLAAAGFDDFSLERTSDALFARAWSEAPDVFPRIPPLCIGFGMISADSLAKHGIDKLLDFEIADAAKLTKENDVLLSYMSNNAQVDPAAESLHLDRPGEVKLWESLYGLAQKLPGLKDEERARYEEEIAERRRRIGDLDGSTKMYAAASSHTTDSYKLKELAGEIDKNKALKLVLGAGAPPLLRELFILRAANEGELARMREPKNEQRLRDAVESGREVSEREMVLLGDLPAWRLLGPTWGVTVRTGPRTSETRAAEVRYEGVLRESRGAEEPPKGPTMLVTSVRGRRLTVRAAIDQSPPPPGWKRYTKAPPQGGGEAGVAFAITRIKPEGGIEKGRPAITIAYAVLLGLDRARLVQITRDGEHQIDVKQLAEAALGGHAGRRALEVRVEAGSVAVSVDGKKVSFPWKPASDVDGFAGFIFSGVGYASIADATISVGGGGR